ncbi:TlpA disulfide reductase family protein [Meiothermus hypogaeus]|uniref:Thiol:disulfide interchange protein n=2 Tax=Meiothermus hypogaeus TaxID=884155 RepID=A0A511QYY8_9DEIN|nr:TlpA disulfide reductase family protein [Meiothermus hypogaeus]RIH80406.1 Thiol-disulfide oxidoreductase ResA [Meiothermus hypogaeus]GEM82601.1 thiol:disulfide interchange protein [Meiothermus hypogaeus NBRC 106114]
MPDALQIGPFLIATVRLVLLTGLLVASWWAARVARRAGLDVNWVTNTAGNLAIAGLLGARLGFVLLNWDGYQANPITALYIWQPGYLPWAGAMGGMAYGLWALSRRVQPERLAYARPLLMGFAVGGAWFALGYGSMGLRLGDGAAVKIGDQVPEIRLMNLGGQPVTLWSLRGKAVVLNFWATWCPPCRREMPLLDSVQAEFKDRGLVVVGVNLNEAPQTVAAYTRQVGVSYPIWRDAPVGQSGFDRTSALYARFGGVGLPTTLFIAPDGTLRGRLIGELNRGALLSNVRAVLP